MYIFLQIFCWDPVLNKEEALRLSGYHKSEVSAQSKKFIIIFCLNWFVFCVFFLNQNRRVTGEWIGEKERRRQASADCANLLTHYCCQAPCLCIGCSLHCSRSLATALHIYPRTSIFPVSDHVRAYTTCDLDAKERLQEVLIDHH